MVEIEPKYSGVHLMITHIIRVNNLMIIVILRCTLRYFGSISTISYPSFLKFIMIHCMLPSNMFRCPDWCIYDVYTRADFSSFICQCVVPGFSPYRNHIKDLEYYLWAYICLLHTIHDHPTSFMACIIYWNFIAAYTNIFHLLRLHEPWESLHILSVHSKYHLLGWYKF